MLRRNKHQLIKKVYSFFEKNLKILLEAVNLLLILCPQTEVVAQSVRALDCGSRGRGFETRLPPI
jgi:hypothetical protein